MTSSADPFGVLVVDKEKGMTSHDVVDLVRRKFRIKKVGHAGTLDPGATGVLVLLLGKATKLSGRFSDQDKEYTAVMKLGQRTNSGDREGNLVSEKEVRVSEKELKETIEGFKGESDQTPPMVSAKKVNGKRLYKLARKGVEVEREPKKIVVKSIEITDVDLPFVSIRVECGKGTYIRQLADDIGEKLGCGAHLTELKRIRSGSFSIEEAISLSSLEEMDRKALDESITRV